MSSGLRQCHAQKPILGDQTSLVGHSGPKDKGKGKGKECKPGNRGKAYRYHLRLSIDPLHCYLPLLKAAKHCTVRIGRGKHKHSNTASQVIQSLLDRSSINTTYVHDFVLRGSTFIRLREGKGPVA